jgi:hypothetical protein
MSARSLNAAWPRTAPQGRNRTAQGLNPGYSVPKRCALKGHRSWFTPSSLRMPVRARTRSGATFRALPMVTRYPELKPWAVLRPCGVDGDEKGGTAPHP